MMTKSKIDPNTIVPMEDTWTGRTGLSQIKYMAHNAIHYGGYGPVPLTKTQRAAMRDNKLTAEHGLYGACIERGEGGYIFRIKGYTCHHKAHA